IVVVFPAPFGPKNPKNSPAFTEKLTPLTASTPPGYVFFRSFTTMISSLIGAKYNCGVALRCMILATSGEHPMARKAKKAATPKKHPPETYQERNNPAQTPKFTPKPRPMPKQLPRRKAK